MRIYFKIEKKKVVKPVGLEALSDLKLVADGPLRFSAIHLWVVRYNYVHLKLRNVFNYDRMLD